MIDIDQLRLTKKKKQKTSQIKNQKYWKIFKYIKINKVHLK